MIRSILDDDANQFDEAVNNFLAAGWSIRECGFVPASKQYASAYWWAIMEMSGTEPEIV